MLASGSLATAARGDPVPWDEKFVARGETRTAVCILLCDMQL